MHSLHHWLEVAHIVAGAIALVVFWLPALARKGSPAHVRYGRWYAGTMLAVSASALTLAALVLADPLAIRYPDGFPAGADPAQLAGASRRGAWFLLMLGLLVFASVRHGQRVLAVRADRQRLRVPTHLATIAAPGLTGLWVLNIGVRSESLLLLIFSVVAMIGSLGMLQYALRRTVGPREWVIEHFGSMIGSGIGAYTAFFAFGGARLASEWLGGNLKVIPWVLPAIIGTIVSARLATRYRRRFERAEAA